MAETTIQATTADLALLAHIDAGKVVDNDDRLPLLHLGAVPLNISEQVWALYRAGWAHQLEGEDRWRLTYRGRDVMLGRAS